MVRRELELPGLDEQHEARLVAQHDAADYGHSVAICIVTQVKQIYF